MNSRNLPRTVSDAAQGALFLPSHISIRRGCLCCDSDGCSQRRSLCGAAVTATSMTLASGSCICFRPAQAVVTANAKSRQGGRRLSEAQIYRHLEMSEGLPYDDGRRRRLALHR